MSDLLLLNRKLKKYLREKGIIINEIQYCPYHPKAIIKRYKKKTNLRKPGNLMIKKILKKRKINLKKSFMIGDQKKDEIAAKKSKLYFEYVSRNFFSQVKNITNNY